MTRFSAHRQCSSVFYCLLEFTAVPCLCAAAEISVTPTPAIDIALENSGARSVLVAVKNTTSPSTAVVINDVSVTNANVNGLAVFLSGEADDSAVYLGLTLPQQLPVLFSNGDNFNFRVNWKPVDTIIDNDIDSANWFVNVRIKYNITSQIDTSVFFNVFDIPEPTSLSLIALGSLVALVRCRR